MRSGLQQCPHGHAGSIVRLLLTAMILLWRKARVLAMGCLGRRSTNEIGARTATSIFFHSSRESHLLEN
jgi:hypothetical protein